MFGICKELCTINSQNYLRHLHQEKHQGVNAPPHTVLGNVYFVMITLMFKPVKSTTYNTSRLWVFWLSACVLNEHMLRHLKIMPFQRIWICLSCLESTTFCSKHIFPLLYRRSKRSYVQCGVYSIVLG